MNNVTNLVAEESWPLNTNVGAFIENTPAVGSWGNGIFGLRNNGVSIAAGLTRVTETGASSSSSSMRRASVNPFTACLLAE